jgi:hypothetical protein
MFFVYVCALSQSCFYTRCRFIWSALGNVRGLSFYSLACLSICSVASTPLITSFAITYARGGCGGLLFTKSVFTGLNCGAPPPDPPADEPLTLAELPADADPPPDALKVVCLILLT